MDGFIDRAATIAIGAIPARKADLEDASGHDDANDCANCGARLTGPYCQVCGQHGHVHRTVAAFFHDMLHGVFHFESKIWRTLPLLIRRPGDLTRRYVQGERAKFVSPMAMFLFSVFLLFAIVANLPGWRMGENAFTPGRSESIEQTRAKLAQNGKKANYEIRYEEQRLARLQRETPDSGNASDIVRAKRHLDQVRTAASRVTAAEHYLPPPVTIWAGSLRAPASAC